MSRALLGISDGQINSNYTFKQIDLLQDQVDALNNDVITTTYINQATQTLVIDGNNNTFDDEVEDKIIIYGHDNNVDEFTGECVVIGTENILTNSDTSICIGHRCEISNSTQSIAIGMDHDVGDSANIINIGINNNLTEAPNNVLIGNNLLVTGDQPNRIIISDTALEPSPPLIIANVVEGSIVLGGGNVPSTLPKIQFLKSDLVDLVNVTLDDVYDPNADEFFAATNGWMRIKYKGQNIKIPITVDDDAPIPAPP